MDEEGDDLDIEGEVFTLYELAIERPEIQQTRKQLEKELVDKFPNLFSTTPRPPQERFF